MSIEGVVVSYKAEKGFGFIKSATVARDIFFHIREFRYEGLPTPGMKVTFEPKDHMNGRISACNIRLVEASQEPHSGKQGPRRFSEEKQKQSYTASASVSEGQDFSARQYFGTLDLDEKRLKFSGNRWFTKKVITRSVRFITSVETPILGPYEIVGGGPNLYVESTNIFFTGKDLKKLISALRSQL